MSDPDMQVLGEGVLQYGLLRVAMPEVLAKALGMSDAEQAAIEVGKN